MCAAREPIVLAGLYLELYLKLCNREHDLPSFNERGRRCRESYREYLGVEFCSLVQSNSIINQNPFENRFCMAEKVLVSHFASHKTMSVDLEELLLAIV